MNPIRRGSEQGEQQEATDRWRRWMIMMLDSQATKCNMRIRGHEIIYKIMYELHNSELICKFINEFICKVENKHSYIMRSFVNHAWIYSMNLYINPLEFWQICLHKFIHKFMYVFHIWFFVWNFKSSPLACSQGPGRWGLADGLPHWQALHSKEYEIQGAALVARAARRMPGWQLWGWF